ncbi:D-alanine--D-alanine ligase [Sulfurimonas aquatica]|uniref:D-alanine--D-alanine ligase n=1 Tax=Sulfurimonas aquatica TaxID=2672570 RepID=A0A975AYU3_9BACT|nr:D-alanine--D-alanine ligase [Sulfurimonas aquatica]QSZ41054.1 D-alanine--D-alanine ligase [Sulfurimonas aquatica]
MNIEIITMQNTCSNESALAKEKSYTNVLEAVKKAGYDVALSICNTQTDLTDIVKRKPDLLILDIQSLITEDGSTVLLSDFFTDNNINFSGSSKEALLFGSNKALAKSYLEDKGIRTPRYFTAVPGEYKRDYDIPINYPLFLQPLSSATIPHKEILPFVNNFNEFETRVCDLYALSKTPTLVEEYLDGRDFKVSIIKAEDENMLVSSIEIITLKSEKNMMNINKEIKTDIKSKTIPIEDKFIKNKVENLAIDAYIDLDIRDYGEINIKMNTNGQCFFMQVNLSPEITNTTSSFLQVFTDEHKLSYENLVKIIVDEGLSRVS